MTMIAIPSLLFVFMVGSVMAHSAALAQSPLPSVDQVGSSDAGAVEQVSDGSIDVLTPTNAEPRQAVTSPRPTKDERIPSAVQLTEETGLPRNSTQVSIGTRSSAGSAPLSSPSEGRTTSAVDRLDGDDRCDPSHRQASATKACALVIERRAAEFASREASPLSPEQRILIEQQRRAFDPKDAARRLASSGTSPGVPELQGVASLVLNVPVPDRTPKPIDDQNGLDAAAAIVNGVLGQIISPPRP